MELKEFDIPEPGAGSVCKGPAVGGGNPGVRRHRVQLTYSTGREHHG
jgi:hypothetical protein